MLCPMHIPVILCGFICGWQYGLLIGVMAPLLRSLTLGMPPIFPTAVAMAFELATYGAISGILYQVLPKKKPFIYVALLIAMIVGRLVWGACDFHMHEREWKRVHLCVVYRICRDQRYTGDCRANRAYSYTCYGDRQSKGDTSWVL